MHHALSAGESPFWNPYSATGFVRSGTLADMKTLAVRAGRGAPGRRRATAFTFVVSPSWCWVSTACSSSSRVARRSSPRGDGACTVWLLVPGRRFRHQQRGTRAVRAVSLFYCTRWPNSAAGRIGRFLVTGRRVRRVHRHDVRLDPMLMLVHRVAAVLLVLEAPQSAGPVDACARGDVGAEAPLVPAAPRSSSRRTSGCPISAVILRGGSEFSSTRSEHFSATSSSVEGGQAVPGSDGSWFGYVGIVPVLVVAGAWSRARDGNDELLTGHDGTALFSLAVHAALPACGDRRPARPARRCARTTGPRWPAPRKRWRSECRRRLVVAASTARVRARSTRSARCSRCGFVGMSGGPSGSNRSARSVSSSRPRSWPSSW